MSESERIGVIENRLKIIEELLSRRDQQDSQHDWKKTTSSLSGSWICEKCGMYTDGGAHDGGGYFPERGRTPTKCSGRKY